MSKNITFPQLRLRAVIILKADNLNETEVRGGSGDGRRRDGASSADDHYFSRRSNDVIVEGLYRNSRIALKIIWTFLYNLLKLLHLSKNSINELK